MKVIVIMKKISFDINDFWFVFRKNAHYFKFVDILESGNVSRVYSFKNESTSFRHLESLNFLVGFNMYASFGSRLKIT